MSLEHAPESAVAETLVGETSERTRALQAMVERGALIGRYVVLDRIGAGAMGVVYAAYDPELDRKVALKVLNASAGESASEHTRLVREAQSLAKLSHPNIVTVHDAGTMAGRVWIAMEFVAGTTLRAWLRAEPRSWRDIVRTMTAAGRGLAAAHAAGLVHRDFKPDNVMVDDQRGAGAAADRVRVMDFGLARPIASRDDGVVHPPGEDDSTTRHARLGQATLRAGLVGTPAYMAPEQFGGRDVDARADQFSFGVTLWEAVYGERPFTGESVPSLFAAAAGGELRMPKRTAGVPGWVRRVAQRAIASDRDERFADMDEVLAALDRGMSRSGVRRGALVVGTLAVAIVGAIVVERLIERRRIAACEEAGAAIEDSWNAEARSRVRAGLGASGVNDAAALADRAIPWIDRHADAWRSARTQLCLTNPSSPSPGGDSLDRALWCLDERRDQLEVVIAELEHADRDTGYWAIHAASGLMRLEPCADADRLARLPTPAAALRDDVLRVREQLWRSWMLRASGQFVRAHELIDPELAHASALGWPPLVAAVQTELGGVLMEEGRHAESAKVLEDAYFTAIHAGELDVAERAASWLLLVTGEHLGHRDEGLRWSRHAEVLLEALGESEGLLRASQSTYLGFLEATAGNLAEAEALHRRALGIRESLLGPEHPDIASSLGALANVYYLMGNYAEADRLQRRALSLQEATFGAEHPTYARTLGNLANTEFALGEFDSAKELHLRSIAITERTLGAAHPELGRRLMNLAEAYHATGDVDETKRLMQRVLELQSVQLGPDHPDVATVLGNLGIVHVQAGDLALGKQMFEKAAVVLEKQGPESPNLAVVLLSLADVESRLGQHSAALQHCRRALAMREHSLGSEHMQVADVHQELAAVLLASGDPRAAEAEQRRALEIYGKLLGIRHPKTTAALLALSRIIGTH